MRTTAILCALLLLAPAAVSDVILDTHGFEAPHFTVGPLDGQHGWEAGGINGGVQPMVSSDWFDPVIGDEQCVRLEVPDVKDAKSFLYTWFDDLVPIGYDRVLVSFDVYRIDGLWVSNFIWNWTNSDIDPKRGIQWDTGSTFSSVTYPFGFDHGSTPTILERWTTVELLYDFAAGLATAWYDGALVDTVPISNVDWLGQYDFELAHHEDTGSGIEMMWIDNVRIIGGPWGDLGHGLATHAGTVPVLAGEGPLTDGSTNWLDLQSMLPHGTAHLVLGVSRLDAPFKGGIMVPDVHLLVSGLPLDSSGKLAIPFVWPSGLPEGTSFYVQFWVEDPAAPLGFAASNALAGTSPP